MWYNFDDTDWDMNVKSKVPFVYKDDVVSYAVTPGICRDECENAMGVVGRDFDGRVLPWRVFVYITPGKIRANDFFTVEECSRYVGVGYVFEDRVQMEVAEAMGWFAGYSERKVQVEVNPAVGYARRSKSK